MDLRPGDDEPSSVDDQELAAQARTDPDAFAALFRRHVGRVHRMAVLRTASPEAAETVATATFEVALGELSAAPSSADAVAPWLCGLALVQLEQLTDGGATGSPPSEGWHSIKPAQREILTLAFFSGLSDDQVALAVGRSRATVAVALQRAVEAVGGMTTLEALAATPVDGPDDAFVDDLQTRLRLLHDAPRPVAARRRGHPGRRTFVLVALGLLAVLALVLLAGGGPPTVELIDGNDLTIVLPDGNEIDAEPGLGVPPGSTVVTGADGFARFENGDVGPDTTAQVHADRIEIIEQPGQP